MIYTGAFVATFCAVAACRAYALHFQILDIPNERSSHTMPTPRGGGLAVVLVWLLGIVWGDLLPDPLISLLLPGATLVAIVSFWDDHKDLGVKKRLFYQGLAAAFLVMMLGIDAFQWWGLPALPIIGLCLLGCIWSTNLFNFMDGTDGFITVEALFVFGGGAWLFAQAGAYAMLAACCLLCACLAGFLCWNWPRARIFMGDVGSTFLGYLVAAMAIAGQALYDISIFYWIILYGAFWMDATLTLLRRIWRREKWTSPHKSHAYQRLHQAGWRHVDLLWGLIALNSLLVVLAYWAIERPAMLPWACSVSIALLLTVYLGIEFKNPQGVTN